MDSESIQLFQDIMSSDDSIRKNAEKKLETLKTMPFDQSLKIFINGMNFNDLKVSNLAALLLKKTLIDDKETFNKIQPEKIKEFTIYLLTLISFEMDTKFLQKIGDIIAKVHFYLNTLPEIFANIIKWFSDPNPLAREFSIYLIETLCEIGAIEDKIVESSISEFNSIFNKGLNDTDVKVRISTLKATTQFYSRIKSKDILNKFSGLVENLIESLVYALKNDQNSGRNALETLNNLTDNYPKIWKSHLDTLINIICQISKQTSFTTETRESAIEIILTIANKTPAFLRKSESFKTVFLPMIFELLLDIDLPNDIEKWNKETDEKEDDKEEMHFVARNAIERLALDIGGVNFLNSVDNIIKTLLSSDNWIHQYAGLIALAWMAEGCKEVFKKNHVAILEYIVKGLGNSHPRVRWAALTALGIILNETAPTLQKNYHKDLIPCIMNKIKSDQQYIRVVTQAASSFVNFLRGLLSKEQDEDEATEILLPYAKDILDTLSTLFNGSLQINYFPLQEESLSCLSLLATILDKEFAPYYPLIMPGLKQIFNNPNITSGELKSQAIQTIGYLISSVADQSDQFMNDFKEILDSFVKVLVNLPDEDSQVPAIVNAFVHISTAMKDKFYDYLKVLFPIIEKYMRADIDFKLEDADICEYRKEETKESIILKLQGIGNKKLSIKTYVLQNKMMAVEVLHDIALNMGKSFNPFLEGYLKLSKDLMKFAYSRKIRKYSIDAIKPCIVACNDDNQVKTMLDFYFPDILALMEYNLKSKLLREIKSTLKTLINTFPLIRNSQVFNIEHIAVLYGYLKDIIKLTEELKATVIIQGKIPEEGFDENDEESIKTDIEVLNELNRRVMELNGNILKLFENNIQVQKLSFELLEPLFMEIWLNAIVKTKNENEILYSICFYDDLLKYQTSEVVNKVYPKFIENCNKYNTTNQDIVQSVIWGFGELARRLDKTSFIPLRESILSSINYLINKKDAFSEENMFTTDNAISSLSKFVFYQCNDGDIDSVSRLLDLLPLKNDVTEGCEVCKILFTNILNKHPLIVNANSVIKLKEVISRIQSIRNVDGEFLDEEGLVLFIQTINSLGLTI